MVELEMREIPETLGIPEKEEQEAEEGALVYMCGLVTFTTYHSTIREGWEGKGVETLGRQEHLELLDPVPIVVLLITIFLEDALEMQELVERLEALEGLLIRAEMRAPLLVDLALVRIRVLFALEDLRVEDLALAELLIMADLVGVEREQ